MWCKREGIIANRHQARPETEGKASYSLVLIHFSQVDLLAITGIQTKVGSGAGVSVIGAVTFTSSILAYAVSTASAEPLLSLSLSATTSKLNAVLVYCVPLKASVPLATQLKPKGAMDTILEVMVAET